MRYLNVVAGGLIVLLAGLSRTGTAVADDQCFQCHSLLEDRASASFRSDIHFQRGISCAACHGGDASSEDMEYAMSEKAGFKGIPKGDTISQVCARCHSDTSAMKPYGN